MADVSITVPTKSSYEKKQDWNPEISSILDAGNNVVFNNEDGNSVNVPFMGLMAGTDGLVKFQTVTGEPKQQKFVSSGYHQVWMHKVYADGTDSTLGMFVKLV